MIPSGYVQLRIDLPIDLARLRAIQAASNMVPPVAIVQAVAQAIVDDPAFAATSAAAGPGERPLGEKKRTSLPVSRDLRRQLRICAANHEMPISDLIRGGLRTAVEDPTLCEALLVRRDAGRIPQDAR